MATMVSSDCLFPMKGKMIFSAQESVKPFILRTKGEPSKGNFFRPVQRKLPPTLLCRSGEDMSEDIFSLGNWVDDKENTAIVDEIRKGIYSKVEELKRVTGEVPRLAIVYVGKDPWRSFVEKLVEACKENGIDHVTVEMREDYSKEEMKDVLNKFNKDSTVHAIHVQRKDERYFFDGVIPEKDIDWCQSTNLWDLLYEEPLFIPPPAKGILEFLLRSVKDLNHKCIIVGGMTLDAQQVAFLLRRHNILSNLVPRTTPFYETINEADIVIHDSQYQFPQDWLKQGGPIVLEVGRCPENRLSQELNIAMILQNALDAAAKQIFA